MRFDNFTNFSWNQEVRADGNVYSDTLDFDFITAELKALNEPWSQLDRLGRTEILIQVTETYAPTSSGEVIRVSAEVASDPAFIVDYLSLLKTDSVLAVDLVAGYKFTILELPEFSQRYVRMKYEVEAAVPFTAGKITAGLVLDSQSNTQAGPVSA